MTKLVIREGTKKIDAHQYKGDLDISELIIADTVEEIGVGAFSGCANLKTITQGTSLHTIGWDAFTRCNSLKSLYLSDSVKRVGSEAFSCSGLTYVEFEDNDDISIYNCAFAFCRRLACAILPYGLKHICGGTFLGCTKLEDVFIPGTVKSIGMKAFSEVAAKQIELPDSVEVIYSNAFEMSKLTSIVVPNSVFEIHHSAFAQCSDLRSVDVGKSVVCIGKKAFENCTMLGEVTFRSAIIGSIGDYIFKKCKKLKRINVPAGAMNAYKRMLLTYLHKKLVEF